VNNSSKSIQQEENQAIIYRIFQMSKEHFTSYSSMIKHRNSFIKNDNNKIKIEKEKGGVC